MIINKEQLPTRVRNFLDRSEVHTVKQLRDCMLRLGTGGPRGIGLATWEHIYQIPGINKKEIDAQREGRKIIAEALFDLRFPNSADVIKKLWRWACPDLTKKELAERLLRNVGYFFYLRRGFSVTAKSVASLILDSGIKPDDFFNAVRENRKEYKQRAKLLLMDNRLRDIKKHLAERGN